MSNNLPNEESSAIRIRWRSEEKVRYSWFVRKLDIRGHFFGDMTHFDAKEQANFVGRLSDDANTAVRRYVAEITSTPTPANESSNPIGVLALFPGNKVLATYPSSLNGTSDLDRLFTSVISIVEPVVFKSLDLSQHNNLAWEKITLDM